jgi:hypothetical protein
MTAPVAAAERDRRFLEDPSPPTARIPFALPTLAPGPVVLGGGGELFPQGSAENGSARLDDVVGQRFLVVGRRQEDLGGTSGRWSEHLGAMVAAAADLGHLEPALLQWMDSRGARVVVVRPDRYVLAACSQLDEVTDAVAELLSEAAPGTTDRPQATARSA